jgi:hypothetical protein
MERSAEGVHPAVGYSAALIIWLGAFVLGNVLGRIVASLQGWDNFSYDRPGGVFYAGIQAGLGAYLAILASRSWLGNGQYARFWLAFFVWLVSGLIVAFALLSIYVGNSKILAWNTLATIVGVVVTEVVRRIPDSEFN